MSQCHDFVAAATVDCESGSSRKYPDPQPTAAPRRPALSFASIDSFATDTAFCDTHEPKVTTPTSATAFGESSRHTTLAPGVSPRRALFAAFWYFRYGHLEARGRAVGATRLDANGT